MSNEVRTENLTPEAVRAKEEFLLKAGREMQKTVDEMQKPELFEDKYGRQFIYCYGEYEEIKPLLPDRLVKAETFETFSLDGLIEYIKADPEHLFDNTQVRNIVQVVSPTKVQIISPQEGYWREREIIAKCIAVIPEISFGRYMDTEDFQIMVQTCFEDSENRAKVLLLAGSVKKEQNMQTADDGVSQKVTINAGVSTAADVIVRNPVELTPYRTFHEVAQPVSPFVIRFNDEARAALFTGDGSKWKLEAVEAIKEYLVYHLAGLNVTVIA